MNQLGTIIASVVLGAIGQVLLKVGANKLGNVSLSFSSFFGDVMRVARTPEIVLGLFFFATSFLLWVKVLTKAKLSYAYPMVSLGYIVVVALSYFLFHEPFTVPKVVGILVIITGVILINM